jgi:hypothetical protein
MVSKDWVRRWSNDNAYLSASRVDVTGNWGDPVALNYTDTGLGPRFALEFAPGGDDHHQERQIQFYWVAPEHDWRQNQTYRNKMTNSWISGREEKEWYYWNINAFIDSDIKIPLGFNGFTCDYVEFPYWSGGRKQVLPESDAKVQMYDFSVGFLFHDSRRVYNPSQKSGGRCRAINGEVTCGNGVYWKYGSLAVFALGFLFCCVVDQCVRRIGGAREYQQIARDEEEEHMEDQVLQSLKRQAVVEMANMENGHDDTEFDDEF